MSRLLLVEDNPDIRLLLEEFLLMAGFEVNAVETVAGGQQFLACWPYDLIVTDGSSRTVPGTVLPRGAGRGMAFRYW